MIKNAKNSYNTFQKWSVITVFFVYALIGIGGVVRSTGAGMGCPDWPRCFGSWIPPTDEKQLVDNYKEVYKRKRLEKNKKIISYLRKLGLSSFTMTLTKDSESEMNDSFNPIKTWIEYLNRLFGVIVGTMILGTGMLSISYWKKDVTVTLIGFLTVVMVCLQGWIGSVVVSTNLSTQVITFHMFMAVAIIFCLLYNLRRSEAGIIITSKVELNVVRNLKYVLIFGLLAILMQIYLGSQVREGIDIISKKHHGKMREEWIGESKLVFYIHRSFSLLILLSNLAIIVVIKRIKASDSILIFWWRSLLSMTILEILTGIGMAYFSIPSWLQPIHLTVAIMVVGIQYWIYTYTERISKQMQFKEK